MAYDLTLTAEERAAFDWVGDRNRTGNEVADIIRESMPEDREWDDPGDITFDIPESDAWRIQELSEEEDGFWPHFDDELKAKMQDFCDSIV